MNLSIPASESNTTESRFRVGASGGVNIAHAEN
jgi:hypothetical protein